MKKIREQIKNIGRALIAFSLFLLPLALMAGQGSPWEAWQWLIVLGWGLFAGTMILLVTNRLDAKDAGEIFIQGTQWFIALLMAVYAGLLIGGTYRVFIDPAIKKASFPDYTEFFATEKRVLEEAGEAQSTLPCGQLPEQLDYYTLFDGEVRMRVLTPRQSCAETIAYKYPNFTNCQVIPQIRGRLLCYRRSLRPTMEKENCLTLPQTEMRVECLAAFGNRQDCEAWLTSKVLRDACNQVTDEYQLYRSVDPLY